MMIGGAGNANVMQSDGSEERKREKWPEEPNKMWESATLARAQKLVSLFSFIFWFVSLRGH